MADPLSRSPSDLDLTKKIHTLSNHVQERSDYISEQRRRIAFSNLKLVSSIQSYLCVQRSNLSLLEQITRRFVLKSGREGREAFISYYGLIVENVRLKLMLLEQDVLMSLVPAASQVREELAAVKEELEMELGSIRGKLLEYRVLGDRFEQMAGLYAKVLREVEVLGADVDLISQRITQ